MVEVLRDAGHAGMHIVALAGKVNMNPGYLRKCPLPLAAHKAKGNTNSPDYAMLSRT